MAEVKAVRRRLESVATHIFASPRERASATRLLEKIATVTSAEKLTRLEREVSRLEARLQAAEQAPAAQPPTKLSPKPRRQCFLIMPFGNVGLDEVYDFHVRPILESKCRLRVQRGDDIFGSNAIIDDIVAAIESADLIVAELTGRNTNVFYELGLGHALGKPTLLLAQSMEDVPFDLRHRRVLRYAYSPKGFEELSRSLPLHVEAVLGGGSDPRRRGRSPGRVIASQRARR